MVYCIERFLFLILTLFRMGFFGAAQGWGWAKRPPFPKICHTYRTMMKLGTVIPYLMQIQKIHESRDTTRKFCWYQHFFTGNQLLLQEIQIQTAFRYIISNSYNFYWVFKDCFINMVTILMMSAKMPTPGFRKIKLF